MRSAIHYPDTELHSPQAMASALLLWDRLNVIVPWNGFPIAYADAAMAEAWTLIGGQICPGEADKKAAHKHIEAMLDEGVPLNIRYRADLDDNESYEIWPQKLYQETWELLAERRMTGAPLANGDYPFQQEAGIAIMAKIADACAGDVFARVTDRMLAYGMIADRDEPVLAQSHVVPVVLELVDAASIPIEKLVEFRRREEKEGRGRDYTAMRHSYADSVQAHVKRLAGIESEAQRTELNRQFRADMDDDLKDLRDALGGNRLELMLKPVVVTAVAGAATAAVGPAGLLAAVPAFFDGKFGDSLRSIADMFSAGIGYGRKQREIMQKHPMAYMYALSRA